MSIKSVMPSNHLTPLLLLTSIFPRIRVFSSESALHIRWPNYWSFNFHIKHSTEYLGLISFRMDWFDFLPVQGTPKSLLQEVFSGMNWESSTETYALPYAKQIVGSCIKQRAQPSALWQPRGMGMGPGGRFPREGIYVWLWLIHLALW